MTAEQESSGALFPTSAVIDRRYSYAIAVSELVPPHFQQVNHFQSIPT
jgi:hypothetical protein